MPRKLYLLLTLLIFSAPTQAQPESWYLALNIGFANNTNPTSVESVIASAESSYGSERISIASDLGVYFPIQDSSWLLGFASNVSADSVSYGSSTIIRHTASLTGFSAIKYVSGVIGNGFFVRGDIGAARSEYDLYSNLFTVDNGSGSGVLLGVGYAIPVSSESRYVFALNIVSRDINGEKHDSAEFTIGGLW